MMTKTEELVKSGALKNLTWTKGGYKGPLFTAEYEGKVVEVRAYGMTSYKKVGPGSRLRDPSGTRYMYKVEVSISGSMPFEIKFGAVVGEGDDSRERINAKKAKIAATVKKYLGLEINEFDYRYL